MTDPVAGLVASNRELAEAIRVQAVAIDNDRVARAKEVESLCAAQMAACASIHALADAIAAPMEDEPDAPQADEVERYMDGTPIE